jgi:hypothetical protein
MYQHPLDAPAAFFRYAISCQHSACALIESSPAPLLFPAETVFLAPSSSICFRNSLPHVTGR